MAHNKVFSLLMAVLCSLALSTFDFKNVTSGQASITSQLVAGTERYSAQGQPGPAHLPGLAKDSGIRRLTVFTISSNLENSNGGTPTSLGPAALGTSSAESSLEITSFGETMDQKPVPRYGVEILRVTRASLDTNSLPVNGQPRDILAWEIHHAPPGEQPSRQVQIPTGQVSDQSTMQDMMNGRSSQRSIPVVQILYDKYGNYDARNTWKDVDIVDLLARAMLAEENEKLLDEERMADFIGAGWVMVNRTKAGDGNFDYAEGNLYRVLTPFQQFALGGYITKSGEVLPGNSAYVANPEAYPGWFGGDVQAAYGKAYQIARDILDGSLPDPTYGALYFADAYEDGKGSLVPFEDGRTRFWYHIYPSYTIEQLQALDSLPWP